MIKFAVFKISGHDCFHGESSFAPVQAPISFSLIPIHAITVKEFSDRRGRTSRSTWLSFLESGAGSITKPKEKFLLMGTLSFIEIEKPAKTIVILH